MATPTPSAPGKLVLEPNVPQLIALKYPTGKLVESRYGDEKQVFFSLVDGRSAYFSLGLAKSITDLQLGTREPFNICKRWNGSKQQAPRYDVWLTTDGERERAELEMAAEDEPPSELEQQLEASLRQAEERKAAAARKPPAPAQGPVAVQRQGLQGWGSVLLAQTNQLIDVYAQAVAHAEGQGVPPAVVRTVMISAFIGLQKKGDFNGR
jgi:hypothetical protein